MEERPQVASVDHKQRANERILVVDDDRNLRQTIQWVLEEEGFPVETAVDGVEALEYIRRYLPAVLVLDLGLPLLDGEAVAREMSALYGNRIPIVLITADGHTEEKGRRIGATAALNKPFEIEELVNAVHYALSMTA